MARNIITDFRWAGRMLRNEKGFAALVVFTLALGIGTTAAVFGMADQVLLRPLAGATRGDIGSYDDFARRVMS
jgi:hypothetical protein